MVTMGCMPMGGCSLWHETAPGKEPVTISRFRTTVSATVGGDCRHRRMQSSARLHAAASRHGFATPVIAIRPSRTMRRCPEPLRGRTCWQRRMGIGRAVGAQAVGCGTAQVMNLCRQVRARHPRRDAGRSVGSRFTQGRGRSPERTGMKRYGMKRNVMGCALWPSGGLGNRETRCCECTRPRIRNSSFAAS